jgi:phytol kinase
MTPNQLASILMVLTLAVAWMLGLAGLQKKMALPPEWCRKLLHMGSGLLALGLPVWFQSAVPVMVLSTASLLGLLALKRIPTLRGGIGRVVDGVDRDSHGDLYFVMATGLLFWFSSGDPLLFSVPMVILTFADSAAALVGQSYGKHRFAADGGTKTVEGSAAFFIVAVAGAYVGLRILGDADPAGAALVALPLGLFLTLVEAGAGRGIDNLLIPLTGGLLLRVLLGSPASLLMLHLFGAVSAGAFAVLMRRDFFRYRTKLHGGA